MRLQSLLVQGWQKPVHLVDLLIVGSWNYVRKNSEVPSRCRIKDGYDYECLPWKLRSSVPQQGKDSGLSRLWKPPPHSQDSQPAPGKVALGAAHSGQRRPRDSDPALPFAEGEPAAGGGGPKLLKSGLAATRNSRPRLSPRETGGGAPLTSHPRHYSLESEADHAPPAEIAEPDQKEPAGSPGTATKRAPAPFKDSLVGVACEPRPRPARRIPGPAQEGWGRLEPGLLSAQLRARDRETKGRIPPLPAVSRPPGIFPRPEAPPPPPALPLLPPHGTRQFPEVISS
ncbi:basic proline-rich protein-like [Zalophus californianus]|uniref:Basic proline-rich protein-like n=1 Tax=Zalophus californianus TaxID=9704 RepID=A0A6J2D5I2_ZALCA|nr:basic proline-rich protein-like [Zalophus californianus]